MGTLKERIEAIKGVKLKEERVKKDTVEIYIEADVNDGDYINETSEIEDQDLEVVISAAKKIMSKDGHNWGDDYDDYLTEIEYDTIDEYMPWMDNQEIHTVEAIKITLITKEGVRFNVKY